MEGFDGTSKGEPTQKTFERYKQFGHSGASIAWFEATAIVDEGRSNPHQLLINSQTYEGFEALITTFNTAREDLVSSLDKDTKTKFRSPLKILQLTHSGRYSKPEKERIPIRAANIPILDEAMKIPASKKEVISDEELFDLQDKYLKAISLARKAGFDGVDIKACHGYLISELLGAFTRTNSIFGGEEIKHRAKFLLDIIEKARKYYPEFLLTTRINLFDALAYPYGISTLKLDVSGVPTDIDLSDMHYILNKLESMGVELVSFSAGNPYFKPYLSRPYEQNAFNGPSAPEHPLKSYERIVLLLRQIKREHPKLITIGTSYSWLGQYAAKFAAGEILRGSFDVAGFGRMSFAHPRFPLDIHETGLIDKKKGCIACSKCTELMRMGSVTGCVIRNPKYKQIYKEKYQEYLKNR
jgi:2,4-dienoyl-CoA reductase-like NADH-dependent reductase (Old Yellow Enzyme family)